MILKKIISNLSKKHILVIGDVVLDQYIKGDVSRISPEAPVPVVVQKESFYTPGGSANVANNLRSLGANVTLVGKIGDDIEGEILKKELKKRKINIKGLFVDKRINTSLKTRIIAQHQQVVRVDREHIMDFGDDSFQKEVVWPFLSKHFGEFDGVIISDYGKGMIESDLVERISLLTKERRLPLTVDPKVEHLQFYGKVTTITPNKKETENSIKNMPHDILKKLGIRVNRFDIQKDIEKAGNALLQYLEIESLLITLGEHGMILFEQGKEPFHIDTTAQEVFDVSGAGDTVISVFTLCLSAGATKRQAASLANYAAGIVVGKMGAVSVSPNELLQVI